MSEETRKRLGRLQAKLTLATGRKLTQQQLLEAIVNLAYDHEEELLLRLSRPSLSLPAEDVRRVLRNMMETSKHRLPPPPEDAKELMKIPMDWGVETKEEEMDSILYGGGRGKQ